MRRRASCDGPHHAPRKMHDPAHVLISCRLLPKSSRLCLALPESFFWIFFLYFSLFVSVFLFWVLKKIFCPCILRIFKNIKGRTAFFADDTVRHHKRHGWKRISCECHLVCNDQHGHAAVASPRITSSTYLPFPGQCGCRLVKEQDLGSIARARAFATRAVSVRRKADAASH